MRLRKQACEINKILVLYTSNLLEFSSKLDEIIFSL